MVSQATRPNKPAALTEEEALRRTVRSCVKTIEGLRKRDPKAMETARQALLHVALKAEPEILKAMLGALRLMAQAALDHINQPPAAEGK